MRYNNRQPVYKPRVYEKREVYHTEVKDGKTIFVKGPRPDPYKDVSCESLKLKSRIDTGTFENHEGSVHKLERAQGSDVAQAQIEDAQRDFENRKLENERKHLRESIRKKLEKDNPEIANLVDN